MDGKIKCVQRLWLLEVFLIPCSDFQDRIIPVLITKLPEGPKIAGIQYWFLTLSHTHKDLMTLCTVNDKVFKVFTILHWEILFWKCSIICKYVFLQTGEPLRSFASLSCAFYTHICVTACCQLAPSVSPAVLFQYCSDSQHLLTLS